jgi:methyl-accepting chemotaxis protein
LPAVRHLKLGYKMSILVAVLVVTALCIAGAAFVGLQQVSERERHLDAVTMKDDELCTDMRIHLLNAVRSQKNAVISSDDSESRKFVEAARASSQELERLRQELVRRRGSDASMAIRGELESFNRNWLDYQAAEKAILDLALQNTNTKALKLCFGMGLEQVLAYESALDALLRQLEKRQTEGNPDPAAAKKLASLISAVEALRTEVLTFHIQIAAVANATAAELAQRDEQVSKIQQSRDSHIAEITRNIDERDRPLLDKALPTRENYQKTIAEIRRLAKIDSNNRAAELSLAQGFVTSDAADKNLIALKEHLRAEKQADLDASRAAMDQANLRMWLVTAIGLLVGIVLAVFVVRSVTRPIARTVEMTQAITQGDLTRRLKMEQHDEVGMLGQGMDRFADQLSDLMADLQAKATQIGKASENLTGVSEQLHSRSEDVSGQTTAVASATEELSRSIESMAAAAEEMSMSIASISSASEEMSVNVSTSSSAAEQTSNNVQAVSHAVNDISVSFQQIAKDAQEGSQVANKASQMATTATATMNSLHHSAVEINKVTETIKMIALQTNLLALNATIEATSAGEAGKGFAVVANEIKELALQSGKAAEGITTKIEGIQESIRQAVDVIQHVAEVIGAINSSAGRISTAVENQTQAARTISLNVKEASKGVGDIARSIAEVASGANDMSKNVGEGAQGARAVSKNASEAAQAANDITASIQEVSTATRETTEGAGRVKDSAVGLTRIGVGLAEIVSKYKTVVKNA